MFAARHFSEWSERDFETVTADGNGAFDIDLDLGSQAPDVRPPRIALERAKNIPACRNRPAPRLLRRHLQLAVFFVFVVVDAQSVKMCVGLRDPANRFGLEVARQAVLPVLVLPLHLALGLRRRGVA